MRISKKLKKVGEKLPREIGRIVSQAGQAIQDLSDAERIMKIGEEIEQEGLSMMEAAKKKLEETNNNVQANETSCSTKDNNNTNNVINDITLQQDFVQQATLRQVSIQQAQEQQQLDVTDHSQDAESESEEYGFVDNLDEQSELVSISSRSDSIMPTMLVQENLELTKKIEELEARLKSIPQNDLATNSSDHVANDEQEQKNSNKNNTAGLHLVLRLS